MSCMADHPSGCEDKPIILTSTSAGFNCWYSSSPTHLMSQLQTNFQPMEVLGFPPKHEPTSTEFYDNQTPMSEAPSETLLLSPGSTGLHLKNRSVFPERSSQGLIRQGVDSMLGHSRNDQLQVMKLLGQFHEVRNSRYLGPAKELLIEFCDLGMDQTDDKAKKSGQQRPDDTDDLIQKQSLYALSLLELHQRKAKLILMLEEVHTRYSHYCNQMKTMVHSFDAVAGNGAAAVYSAMASRAMSRHLRCLKDAILAQIKATSKAVKDKDSAAVPGTSKGETPRLRILDQTLRQQRAFQQMNMMESHPWRPQRGLPERAVSVLRAWLFEHFLHPYPSDVDKNLLARQTGLSRSQVSNWFINARVRLWKPMVEQMYLEDLKDNHGDQKPTKDPTVGIESDDCLSSIVKNNEQRKLQNKYDHQHNSFGTVADQYGAVQFDFSSAAASPPVLYPKGTVAARHNYGGTVSLTLGLHQHGGSGGGGFSPAASQSSLFLQRADQMEDDCQTAPYSSSLLDSENQNLVKYRDLMGAQLLHDLAG